MAQEQEKPTKIFTVSSSPHLSEPTTSRRVMLEVMIALLPAVGMSVYLFQKSAVALMIACVVAAMATEAIFNLARRKAQTLDDGSALLSGLILALSLPPTLPLWMGVLGSVVAIAVAKMLFGGLGGNIFNPAMVGRAFLMASFGTLMTSYVAPLPYAVPGEVAAVTQATPLSIAKQVIKDAHDEEKSEAQKTSITQLNPKVWAMFMGQTSGSAGETSALACLVGGAFLLLRRTITWHIPVAVLGSAMGVAAIAWWADSKVYPDPLVHLCGGSLMFGAFFIATDPVTCPMSKLGRLLFGAGVGILTMLIRLLAGYPEGLMFAVLIMNALTPLLDRWTRPQPLGGHVRAA